MFAGLLIAVSALPLLAQAATNLACAAIPLTNVTGAGLLGDESY
jgi:hypothetical protein